MKHGLPDADGVRSLRLVDTGVVESQDLDFNGHMNVLVYLRTLIRSTMRGLDTWTLGYEYAAAHAHGLFSIDHHVQYLSELRLGEGFTTHLRLIGSSDRAVHTMAYMFDTSSDKVACTLETLFLNVDHETRRSDPFAAEVQTELARAVLEDQELCWDPKTCGSLTLPGLPSPAVDRY